MLFRSQNGIDYIWYTSGIYCKFSSTGTFTYNPQLIVAGDGSSATGHLICKNTYNVSDAGKGDANVYAFEYYYYYNLCQLYGIPFVDNNDNTP